jgi:hypothetical protein
MFNSPACANCRLHARNLRRGQPCPGCGKMTTVEWFPSDQVRSSIPRPPAPVDIDKAVARARKAEEGLDEFIARCLEPERLKVLQKLASTASVATAKVPKRGPRTVRERLFEAMEPRGREDPFT